MDDVAAAMRVKGHKWTRATVFNIEHGKRQLKLQEAVDLLNILHLDLESGIRRLTAENPEKARVQEYVQDLWYILTDDLPRSILRLKLIRYFLNGLWLQLLDEEFVTSPQNRLDFTNLNDACKELGVYDLLRATNGKKILKLVEDLFSVPVEDILTCSKDDGSIDLEDIGIYRKHDGSRYDLAVMNKISGKEYHAQEDDNGEAHQANE